MKKIMMFVAIVATMVAFSGCGNSSTEPVVDEKPTQHPLVGKKIQKVGIKNNIDVNYVTLLTTDRRDGAYKNPVDSMGYAAFIFYPDSIKFSQYIDSTTFSVTAYYGKYPENFERQYTSDSLTKQYKIIYIKE